MADITMCRDIECPDFARCYRALAPINEWRQSYFAKSPRKEDGCGYMWPEPTLKDRAAGRRDLILEQNRRRQEKLEAGARAASDQE